MKVWLVFIIGGIGTYVIRASFFALGSSIVGMAALWTLRWIGL